MEGDETVSIDVGENYFVALTDTIKTMGGWDEQFPINSEHIDFFLRAKECGLRVVHCPDAHCRHRPDGNSATYTKSRNRRTPRLQFMQGRGIRMFNGPRGLSWEAKGEQILTHRKLAHAD